ncbi:MAG: hypothetical protein LBR43_03920 [Spiroplasmataceae bacterium]|jgi:hypothetical protein|nr:hypothetical protein [Spiroplasmataceae bacterium]
MKTKELQNLAQKIQLELKEQEMETYLKNFVNLEKLLTDFKNIQVKKTIKPMERINVGYLDLKSLKKTKKSFFQSRITIKNQKTNSLITNDEFVLFKK